MFSYGAVWLVNMSQKKARKSEVEVESVIPQEGLVKFLQTKVGLTKDAAIKIFPDLAKFLTRGAEAFRDMHKKASDSNSKSQEKYMDHEAFLAQVYAEQLRLETLSPEERTALLNKLQDGAKRLDDKDSENKQFEMNLLKLAATGVVAALALVVVVLSAKSIDDKK